MGFSPELGVDRCIARTLAYRYMSPLDADLIRQALCACGTVACANTTFDSVLKAYSCLLFSVSIHMHPIILVEKSSTGCVSLLESSTSFVALVIGFCITPCL